MSSDELLIRSEGPVRWISLNRPSSKNGLTVDLNRQIIEAFDAAGADASVRVVVLGGEGGNFCSGLDLRAAMSEAQLGTTGDEALERRMNDWFHGLIRAVVRCPKPVLALVDGPAVGFGCDLALACDLRIGTPRARFGEIFVKRGLMPDGGGTYHLSRLVGMAKTLELMMLGEMVEADEAARLGLLSRVVPVDSAQAAASELAGKLAAGAPLVHALVKSAVRGALGGTLEEALAVERKGQIQLLKSQDFAEGIVAFFEKRPPKFIGK